MNKFSQSKNIEVIHNSISDKEFRNFIKENDENNKKILKKVAFIARFKDLISEYQTKANAITLTCNFVKERKEIGEIFYLQLVSVDIHQIQKLNYQHKNILKINESINLQTFQNFDNEKLLVKKQLTNLDKFKDLTKAIDIFDNNDSLKILKQKDFIHHFYKFLDSKKEEVINAYLIDDDIEKEYVKLNSKNKLKIMIIVDPKTIINENSKNQDWIISSYLDYEAKIKAKIVSYQQLNLDFCFKSQLEKIEELKKRGNQTIESLTKEIIKSKKQIKENQILLTEQENNLEKCRQKKKKLFDKKRIIDKKIAELKVNLSSLNTKIKQNQKVFLLKRKFIKKQKYSNQSSKSKDSSFIKLSQDYDQAKINLKNQNLEKQKIIKNELINNQEITKNQTQINNLKNIKNEIPNKQKQINKIEDDNNFLKKDQQELNKQWKKCVNNNMNSYLLDVKFIFDDFVTSYKNKELQEIKNSNALECMLQVEPEITISNFDIGFYSIIKRWDQTYYDYWSGNYKSPYALISLDKPETKIIIEKDVKIADFELNNLQQQAINAIHNAHFAAFLQGPPGTGKTQVISASILKSVSDGENVVLSSSTNEAINNAFDRIYKDASNPNLFMIRYSKDQNQMQKSLQYSSNALYKNFINNICKFVENKNLNPGLKDAMQLEKMYSDKKELNDFYVPPFKLIFLPQEHEIIDNFKKIQEAFPNIDDIEYFNVDIEAEFKRKRIKLKRKFAKETKKIDAFINKYKKYTKYELLDTFKSYLKKFSKQKTNQQNNFVNLIQTINKKFNEQNKEFAINNYSEEMQLLSEDFAKDCFNNEKINVIGITTTSRLEIGINNLEKRKELFTDYHIDVAIIDEISKSVTPEILAIAKLARRFIFAGDYCQLPSQFNFDEKKLEDFFDYINSIDEENNFIFEWIRSNVPLNNKNDFIEYINNLFQVSLFQNQVMKIKIKTVNFQNSYVALKEQYRFGEKINAIVNLTYDDDEKLENHFLDQDFEKFKLGNRIKKSNSINAIDTTYLTSDFINKYELSSLVKTDEKAFDSNYSLIKKFSYLSKVNDFNAFVIVEIIKNLKKLNPHLSFQDVGVITMTRSQAMLINSILKQNQKFLQQISGIKIDTVDNFQGREKKLIILDLVRAQRLLEKEVKQIKVYSPHKRNLDYYKSPERINVSISRAQNKLIIVGALEYLVDNVKSKIKTFNQEYKEVKLLQEWQKLIKKDEGVLIWKEF